ncbi:MAG: hypothetical protein RSB59_05425, partial [Clostridia bacterium]
MNTFWLLLKKQLKDQFVFLQKDKKNIDIFGLILSILLVVGIILIVVYVLQNLAGMYVEIKVDRVVDKQARAMELLVFVNAIILIVNVFSGVKNINFSLFQSDDLRIFVYMPIKPAVLYLSKMLSVYIKQFVLAVLTIVPIYVTIGTIVDFGWNFYAQMTLITFLLPLLSLSIGSMLAFPVYYIQKLFQSKYVLLLIVTTAVVGIISWGYSSVLVFVKDLLTTGDIKFFFNAEMMEKIGNLTANLYPVNFVANMLVGKDVGINLLIIMSIVAVSMGLGLLISRFLLVPTAQGIIGGKNRKVFESRHSAKSRGVTLSLMRKEFLQVLRTPSYAFQYFSTALIMPLLVYFCISIFAPLVRTLVFVNCDLELSIFLIVMFGVLTNTFCATNISRDGEIFFIAKTMPIGHRRIVLAKILFCFAISATSIVLSCAVITVLGYVSVSQCFFVMFVTLLISIAQICFATRKDFNHPRFSSEEDCEIKESNSTISLMIILGLVVSFAIGAVTLYSGLVLKVSRGVAYGEMVSMV